MSSSSDSQTINQHYAQFDKLFEHRTRLAICALLVRFKKISFSRFKELLKESDGNLGAQLRKLEDAAYINISKEFVGRRPVSWYSITKSGKSALQAHVDGLEALLNC